MTGWWTGRCCECGIAMALPPELYAQRSEDGKDFYCPNGHPQHFVESCKAKLAREKEGRAAERARAERLADKLRHTEQRLRAQRGATTRLRRKLAEPLRTAFPPRALDGPPQDEAGKAAT